MTENKRQYNLESYAWFKEHGICVTCQKDPAAPNKVRCFECEAKILNSSLRSMKNNREHYRQYNKRFQSEKMKAGLCVVCGKPRSEKSTRWCDKCLMKHRLDARRYREKAKWE